MIYYLLNDLKLHLLYIILDFFRPEMHYKKNIKFLYTNSEKKLLIISYPSSGWHFFKNVLLRYFNFKNLFLNKLDKKYKFSSIHHSHLPIYMLPHYRFQKIICIKREPVTTLYSYYQKHQKKFFINEGFLEFIKNKRLKYLKRFNISLKNIPHYTINYEDMRKKPNYTFNKILKLISNEKINPKKLKKAILQNKFTNIKKRKKNYSKRECNTTSFGKIDYTFLGKIDYRSLVDKKTISYIYKNI